MIFFFLPLYTLSLSLFFSLSLELLIISRCSSMSTVWHAIQLGASLGALLLSRRFFSASPPPRLSSPQPPPQPRLDVYAPPPHAPQPFAAASAFSRLCASRSFAVRFLLRHSLEVGPGDRMATAGSAAASVATAALAGSRACPPGWPNQPGSEWSPPFWTHSA